MQYRTFGRTGWNVSEIGYGMWGMAGWTGSDDEESRQSLDRAVALGCNFFDTAWAYGEGRSEQLLGELLKRHPGKRIYTATKIPPKNRKWPARPEYPLSDVFPADYIRDYTKISLRNLGITTVDLQQFHVWDDSWATDVSWQRAVGALKEDGLVNAIGISINRWQPANVLKALGDRPHRQRAGRLQHLRPGAGGRAVRRVPAPQHRGDRARAVRRRQPHRDADADTTMAGRATSATSTSSPRT